MNALHIPQIPTPVPRFQIGRGRKRVFTHVATIDPFDMKLAKEGHPLITRDGRKAKWVQTEKWGARILIEGRTSIYTSSDGKYYPGISGTHPLDLFLLK